MLKKTTSILLSLVMVLSMFAALPFSVSAAEDTNAQVGDGDVTEIRTVEDLYMINTALSGNYKLMNDIDLTEATAQGGDWDFGGRGWEPIGSNGVYSGNNPFTGTFDGNGCEIKGLRINVNSLPSGTGSVNIGLFSANAGTIKNLTVSGNITTSSNVNVYDVGAIAGYNSGTIEACCSKVNISAAKCNFAGGIAGLTSDKGKVKQCYNTGNVSATRNNTCYSSGITDTSSGSTVSDCYNTGTISAKNTYNSSDAYSGGISASSYGTISRCYDIGTAAKAISYGTVTNCYFLSGSGADTAGAKLLTASQMKQTESFIGFDFKDIWFVALDAEYTYPQLRNNKQIADSTPSEEYQPTIHDGIVEIRTVRDLNYVNKALSGNYKLMNDIDLSEATAQGGDWDFGGRGWEPIGSNGVYSGNNPFTGTFDGNGCEIKGLRINVNSLPSGTGSVNIGLFSANAGTIKNLTVSGNITTSSNVNVYDVGAIAGYNSGTIEACCSKVNISAAKCNFAGGIAGLTSDKGKVKQCYNTGNVSATRNNTCYSSGITDTSSGSTVSDCYNTGTISAKNTYNSSDAYSGGISASSYGTISRCYDIGTAAKAISYGTVTNCYFLSGSGADTAGAKLLTASQMKQTESFIGFDFKDIWFVALDAEYTYPQLRNNKQIADSTPSEEYQPTIHDGIVEIRTVRDLNYVNKALSGNYKLMNDIDLSEATAQGGDWDFGGRGWEPIGSNGVYSGNNPFTGTFDGNGCEIKGLRINVNSLPSGTGSVNIGLFSANAGTIKNLTVSGNITTSSNVNVYDVGAIAGYNSGTIEACCSKVNISAAKCNFAGGIAGLTSDKGKVKQCYNTGNVSATRNNTCYSSGITDTSSGSTVSDCYNTGTISAKNTYNSSDAYSGGISASSYGTISRCYDIGTAAKAISYGTVTNCYFLSGSGADTAGAKLLTASQMKQTESFIGFDFKDIWFVALDAEYTYPQLRNNKQIADSTPSEEYQPTIHDGIVEIRTVRDLNYVNKALSGNYKLMNDIDLSEATAQGGDWDFGGRGWEPIGSNGVYSGNNPFTGTFDGNGCEIKGLRINVNSLPSGTGSVNIGLFSANAGTIKNLTVSGNITTSSNVNVYDVGAIAGYNSGTIEACCSKVNISAAKCNFAGGIAGLTSDKGKVKQCYNTGNVSATRNNTCYSSGITDTSSGSTVSDCYNTGTISAKNTYNSSDAYSGGISASSYGTISRCYDIGTAAKAISYGTVTNCYFLSGSGADTAGAKSLTAGQMKLKDLYSEFDFDKVWFIDSNGEYIYPQLRNNTPYSYPIEGIAVSDSDLQLDIGTSKSLTIIFEPDYTTDSREITWESSDETIASVDNDGKVTANKVGSATITATASNGKKAECVVEVLVPMKSIAFEQSSYTVPRSQKQKLNLIVNPKDTTDTYTLTSSDTAVAMIDKYGNLTARKVGTAIITAETNRGLKATCEVTVNSPATSVQLSSRELTLFAGKEATLTATLAPGDVTDSVQWKSSNSKVATVTNDGKVTAKEAGKATITATANSGVYDTCEVIVVSDMNKTEATLDCITIEYDTTPQTPSVSVYFNDVLLIQDVDYRVEYDNNIDAGEAIVTIISLSDGTFIERTFTITAADISKCKIVSKADMEYSGNPLECVEEITFNDVPLVKNVDYTVSYSNNTDTGTAGYEIICKGNYKGSVTGTFTITPKSVVGLDATVNTGTFTYDGTEKTPGVTVKDGAKTLKENKDYTLSYSKNVNAGIANVTIIGKGNYTGRISREFTIRKKSINNLLFSLDESEFVYDGKTHSPSVTVKYDNITLRKGVDYEVSYDSNINAGTSTVIVTGKGNYDGEQSIQYSILSKSIENVSITVEPDVFDYDGTEKQPAVTVYDGGNLLNVNVDYVISYEKNRDVGTAKVIVRGIGNYGKSAEALFDIRYMIGDVNGDGSITISDVTEIQNHLAEIVDFTDMQLSVADTNGDGKVDIADASHLQLYLAEYDVILGKS